MKAKIIAAFLAVIVGGGLFAFNNCSQVGFQPADTSSVLGSQSSSVPSSDTSGVPGAPGDSGSIGDTSTPPADPTEEQIIIDRIPPDQVGDPVPVEDLEKDPSLYDLYKCGDGNSVMICHFPENVESQNSSCIGIPAAKTHYDHHRQYMVGDELRSISDYLGPCRIPL